VAALIYSRSSAPVFSGVPWTEIVASSAAAALLILAIGLSSGIASAANSTARAGRVHIVRLIGENSKRPSRLAGHASGMLT